jgi:hypothetical protein
MSARVLMGTEAQHHLGDISRDKPDYFYADQEDNENYYGAWVTGLGFVNVRFPKATSRPMTDSEAQWFAAQTVVIA